MSANDIATVRPGLVTDTTCLAATAASGTDYQDNAIQHHHNTENTKPFNGINHTSSLNSVQHRKNASCISPMATSHQYIVDSDAERITKDESSSKDNGLSGNIANDVVQVPRNIGLIGGISFVVGTIIGSGIFVSPRGVASRSGSVGLTIVNWIICGVISTLGAFCYAELGTIIKESGADYTYLHFAYGPVVSYINSWVNNLLVKPASLTLIILTGSEYLIILFFDDNCGYPPEVITKTLAIFILLLLTAMHVYSGTLAARIQIIFTVTKLVALAIVIIGGLVKLLQGNTTHLATGFANTETNPGTVAVGLYSGMWAYDGWNTVNFITEELINPKRNIPLSIIIGMPLVTILYVLTNISYFTVMSLDELVASPAVGVTWAERVIPAAAWLVPIVVAMSTFGTANGTLFSGCRMMFTAARNEHLPGVLAMVHCQKCTPIPALIFTAFTSILFMIAGEIGVLIDFVSFLLWIFYGMNILAVIVFRFRKNYRDLPRPFKVPMIVPIIAFLASLFLVVVPIVTDPRIEFIYAIVLIAVGFVVWLPFVYFRLRLDCMKKLTMYVQLFLQVVRPQQSLD